METRKRKNSRSEEDILLKYKDAQIKDCVVNIVKMDIDPILLGRKPLSNKDIERILQDTSGESNDSDDDQIISPQSKNRLRKKENGMVFIPRSKYNEHPAKSIISTRKSKRSKPIIKVKLSPKRITRNKSKSNSSPIKISKNNNSIYKKSSQSKYSSKNNNKSTNVKKNKAPLKQVIEYHLVFSPPRNVNKRKKYSRSVRSLSDFMKIDSLPSKLWEIERVPPLIHNVEEDDLTKELRALTEESKEETIDKSECSSKDSTLQDSNNDNLISDTTVDATQTLNVPETQTDDTSLKDELEALLSDVDTSKKIEMESESSLIKENILPDQVEVDNNIITNEDIEKTIKDVEMEVCQNTQDTISNDIDMDVEKLGDVQLDSKSESDTFDDEMKSRQIKDDEYKEDEIKGDETEDVKDDKLKEVEDNILKEDKDDLAKEDESEVAKDTSKEDAEKDTKDSENKVDTNELSENKTVTDVTEEDCIALRRPKRTKKEKSVHFQDTVTQSSQSEGEKNIITSLIFRKYSENKKTYEKVVVFSPSLDYTVTINNKLVELIGAPEEMTSIEDLQILLQIVDESNLESFNVICKS